MKEYTKEQKIHYYAQQAADAIIERAEAQKKYERAIWNVERLVKASVPKERSASEEAHEVDNSDN